MATPSLLIIPDRYKAAKLYSQLPESGAGDFTVTRGTTATRVNASGLIESVASGVPRIDYTGGGCGSLLVEPAATNLVLQSQTFETTWSAVTATITANNTTAPDGTLTADKLVAAVGLGTSTQHRIDQTTTSAIGANTFSVYAKKSEIDIIQLRIATNGASFNLTNGTFGSLGGGVTASILNAGNGWFRCAITFTSVAPLEIVRINLAKSASVPDSFVGNGTDGAFIWGAQLETGSVATSYIPTVATTQTRNADVISLSSVSGLIGQTEGTLYAEVDVSKLLGTVVRGMLTISNNTTANRIQIGFTGASANTIRVIYSGASTLNYNFAITTTGIYKIAFAYSASSTAFYVNGSLVSALGGNSFSASVGNVYLGSVFDGTSALNDRISAAAIYTERLSNSELAQLTTL